MSFTVEEKNEVIDMSDIYYSILYDNIVDWKIDSQIEDFDNLPYKYVTYSVDIKDRKMMSIDDLEFSIKEINSGNTEFIYKVVKTDGPIVGFLGSYIDLESGYIVMGGHKSDKFIALFDYYKYLKKFGVYITKESMSNFIERFKIWDVDLNEIAFKMNNLEKIYSASIISRFISDEEEGVGELETIKARHLKYPFLDMSLFISRIQNLVGDDKETYKTISDLENQSKGISEFLYPFLEESKKSYRVGKFIREKLTPDREDAKFEEVGNKLRNLSTMVHTSRLGPDYVSSSEVGDMQKVTSEMLNMYDIVDSYEESDEALIEMDDLLTTSKPDVDNKTIHAVRDKIGAREYLSGGSLGALAKRFRHNKDKIVYIINKVNKDINYSMRYNTYSSATPIELVYGFKKNIRFYKRVLKEIDQVMR